MADKSKYSDRILSKHGGTKFDGLLSSNDGGEYSPSTRRLRHQYRHATKYLLGKVVSTPIQLSSAAAPVNERTHQSSASFMSATFKCDDCRQNDGLFQCSHCNQRLCIRCCNKHYKKVTVELDYLHELTDHLVTKIIQTKADLERQKYESIERCHQWRIDTMNAVNRAHTLIIQTIHNEYETLRKEHDLFVDQEMAQINITNNEFIRMKKGNLGSLLSSPAPSTTIDLTKSIDTMRTRIEVLTKYIDDIGHFSFQVSLPTFNIDDNLRVESRFADNTRNTSAVSLDDSARELDATSSYGSFRTVNENHHRISSISSIDSMNSGNGDAHQHVQLKSDQDNALESAAISIEEENETTEQQRVGMEAAALPLRSMNTGQLSHDYSWIDRRTTASPSSQR